MMKGKTALNWGVYIIFFAYLIIIINLWIQQLAPIFYNKYFVNLNITTLYNIIGVYILFGILILILLHVTNIFRLEKKIFWVIFFLFLSNLLLVYLELREQGDS